MSDETVRALLDRLASVRVEAAWTEFLARYSPLIMHVVRRHAVDDERATDCFIHVCGALSDDHFRRLRSFRPDGPARFRTWLLAVVSNLCVDWRRGEYGRIRSLKTVSRLPELDQHVYRCIFERGMSRAQCLHVLQQRFPDLTEQQVAEINSRLFTLLTPQQRWLLSVRATRLRPVAAQPGSEDEDPTLQMEEPGALPDEAAAEFQAQRQLQDALARLPNEQRLLLRMRYEQDLTLADIARLTRQPDPFRVNRQVHSALEALARLMGAERHQPERKKR